MPFPLFLTEGARSLTLRAESPSLIRGLFHPQQRADRSEVRGGRPQEHDVTRKCVVGRGSETGYGGPVADLPWAQNQLRSLLVMAQGSKRALVALRPNHSEPPWRQCDSQVIRQSGL